MKANELRIGNLANHSELGVVEIIAVGKDYIHCTFNGETFYEDVGRFSPIVLNEEWLLKFGFEETGFEREIDAGRFYKKFELVENGKVLFNFSFFNIEEIEFDFDIGFGWETKKIQYIHQIQNLFYGLYDKELELKNEGI